MWGISEKQGCKNKVFAGVWIEKDEWFLNHSHGSWKAQSNIASDI